MGETAVQRAGSRKWVPLYPWLISLYPVLALLGQNVDQVSLAAGARPLALSLAIMTAAILLGRLLLRTWPRAAAAATLGYVLFFSYGHIYGLAEQTNDSGRMIGQHRYLLSAWVVILLVGIWRILRTKDLARWTPALNSIAGLALAIPILQIAWYEVRIGPSPVQGRSASTAPCALRLPVGEPAPDIYYIILDGYMRDDVLLETTGYDNTPFLQELRELGFVIPRRTRSNYPWTDMSLSSSLNLSYLPELGWPGADQDWTLARTLISNNVVRRELECLGYTSIAFETGYPFSEWRDADYFLMAGGAPRDRLSLTAGITQFEWMWINTSVGRVLAEFELTWLRWPPLVDREPGDEKRERVIFDLEQLPALASGPGPRLIFVHLISPHFPFVFGPDGEHSFLAGEGGIPYRRDTPEAERFWRAYAGELEFLNRLVLESIRGILARSSTPPIIVLQGDHGFVAEPPEKKPPILNAYYLPGGRSDLLYDDITPVNTFRLIFNSYFGGNYQLLDDVSYCTLHSSNDIDLDPCAWTEAPERLE